MVPKDGIASRLLFLKAPVRTLGAGRRPAITSLCEKASRIATTEPLVTLAERTERPALLAPASSQWPPSLVLSSNL
jgi:hypothetical protein